MISWIQIKIQKHNKLLFSLLLCVIIVAFVFTIGNLPVGGQGPTAKSVDFYGVDLQSRKEAGVYGQAVEISSYLNSQRFYFPQQQEYAVLTRILMTHMANELHIPLPDKGQLIAYMHDRPIFQGADGAFDGEQFGKFIDQIKSNPDITEEAVYAVAADDYRFEQLGAVLGGAGFILPQEAWFQERYQNTSWSIDLAILDYASFEPELEFSDEDVKAYFDANAFRYQVPEREQVSYVLVPSARFQLIDAEVNDASLRVYYDMNRRQFPEISSFDAGKEQVRERYIQVESRKRAEAYANNDIVLRLYKESIKADSEAFKKLFEDANLKLQTIEPYSEDAIPSDPVLTYKSLAEVFNMTRYYSDAMPVRDGFAVLFKGETLPPYMPDFEVVKDAVLADFKKAEKQKAFDAKGAAIHAALTKALEAGETFEASAKNENLEFKSHYGFTRSNPPANLDNALMSSIAELEKGALSEMITQGRQGYFVYLVEKEIPEIKIDDVSVMEQMERLSQVTAQQTQRGIVDEWLQREMDKHSPAEEE